MNVLIIAAANIRLSPYIQTYLNYFSEKNIRATLYYWDRDGLQDPPPQKGINVISFKRHIKNQISPIGKIYSFFLYRKRLIQLIRSNQYDFLIVCTSQIAVLLSDVLLREYKARYILDYRDPSYERFSLYKRRLVSIVRHSRATFISSNAYREYFPECHNVYLSHNILINDLEQRNIRRDLPRNTKPIRIVFWGYIRDTQTNISLVSALGNDDRFELHFHGTIDKTAHAIAQYCKDNAIGNIFIHKEYQPRERYVFVAQTDIIHNVYGNSFSYKSCIGNKFYDAIMFYLPQICTDGGFMGKVVQKYGVGITINLASASLADQIYTYYTGIQWHDFEAKCDAALSQILAEQRKTIQILDDMVSDFHP